MPLTGGLTPARAYLPDLVLAGALNPGSLFDKTVSLDDSQSGYAAMNERTATKVLVLPG